jgi:hypothetical protein
VRERGRNASETNRVPDLDHAFVIVLENHNSYSSFGSNGILDHPQAPHLQALASANNLASNYHGIWHPSLPNTAAPPHGARGLPSPCMSRH